MAIAALALVGFATTQSTPAFADRCQPEELIGQEPIIPEGDHPGCQILINYVYPILCDDYSTLNRCTQTLDPTFNGCVTYDFAGSEACAGTDGVDTGP